MLIKEIIAMSSDQRIKKLQTMTKKHEDTIKTAAKILASFIHAGDCPPNELNKFSKEKIKIDLRSQIQGIYQATKVFGLILKNELGNATEAHFDKIPWSANIELSRFLEGKHAYLRDKAIECYLGETPVKKLKELFQSTKTENEKSENTGNAPESTTTETAPVSETTAPPVTLRTVIHWIREQGDAMTLEKRDKMLGVLYKRVFAHYEKKDFAAQQAKAEATRAADAAAAA